MHFFLWYFPARIFSSSPICGLVGRTPCITIEKVHLVALVSLPELWRQDVKIFLVTNNTLENGEDEQ
jgi:hypothetical protein